MYNSSYLNADPRLEYFRSVNHPRLLVRLGSGPRARSQNYPEPAQLHLMAVVWMLIAPNRVIAVWLLE